MKNKKIETNWLEVVNVLEPKTGFRYCDVKEAFKKTGRSFEDTTAYYDAVREFFKYLGDRVVVELKDGENYYTLTKEEHLIRSTLLDKPEETIVADIIGRKKNVLSLTIKILAVFLKHKSNEIPGNTFKKEFHTLGLDWKVFLKTRRTIVNELLSSLGYQTIKCIRGNVSKWTCSGNILDAFMKFQEIYKKITGKDHENLDDFISSEKKIVEKRQEILKELKNQQSKIQGRKESTEIKWKKWLLLEALKARQGTTSSVKSLTSWIETVRLVEISENEAIRFFHEMQHDSGCFKFGANYCVSFGDEKKSMNLFKLYDPKKITENVYIKVKLTPEELNYNFPGMVFSIDETLEGGKYIYNIVIDRSFKMESYLKKLLRIIRISGSIYSNSFMVTRVSEIIEKEDRKTYPTNQELLSLENF